MQTQDKYRVREINGRYQVQRRVVWDRWENVSNHGREANAYRAMRRAERQEMKGE